MPSALIAEDESLLRAQLIARLAEAWPELEIVGEAENGEDAVAIIEEAKPDVVFLDIRMPGLSGIEVARRLGGRCHLVFVTAFFANEYFDFHVENRIVRLDPFQNLVNVSGGGAP